VILFSLGFGLDRNFDFVQGTWSTILFSIEFLTFIHLFIGCDSIDPIKTREMTRKASKDKPTGQARVVCLY